MHRSILFAFMLSLCPAWLPIASPASEKEAAESVLVSVEGCLKMSVTEYVIIDENTGTQHNLIGDTAKLKHYVGRRVQIIGEPTNKTSTPPSRTSPQAPVEVPAIRVQSGRQIGGRCGW